MDCLMGHLSLSSSLMNNIQTTFTDPIWFNQVGKLQFYTGLIISRNDFSFDFSLFEKCWTDKNVTLLVDAVKIVG